MQTGQVNDRPADLLFSRWPTLPPEPQPPSQVKLQVTNFAVDFLNEY